MGLFVGSHENPIDKKGRVSIPAPFRAALGEPVKSIYAFPSVDPRRECVVIWSVPEMTRLIEKMRRNYKAMTEQERRTAKLAIRGSRQITVDDNGRMQLPADMMQRLGITNSVTFAGDGFYCSIWAPHNYSDDMDDLMSGRVEDGESILMELAADDGGEVS